MEYGAPINLRLTPEQNAALRRIAGATGIGISDLVRSAVVDRFGLPKSPPKWRRGAVGAALSADSADSGTEGHP